MSSDNSSRRPVKLSSLRRLLATLLVLLVPSFPARVLANGRFPESNAFFFAPRDPQLIVLRTSFGLLVSHDRGGNWDWVCEQAIGLAGIEDPMYAITTDGTFIASTYQGLTVTRDGACTFAPVEGALKDLVFVDVAARPGNPDDVITFASSYGGQTDAGEVFFKSTLFETTDQGKTFGAVGPSFDPSLLGETVDFAATDPDRIYVSAVRSPGTTASAFLLTSRDHGKTWQENAMPLEAGERAAYIAAVDPKNAERVYLRTRNAADKPSRLVLTDDGGKTYRTVFTALGPLAGFALSADGARIWVGGVKDGLNVANTTDFAFQQRSKVEIQCLALASDGLWACSNEKSGFVAALSKDDGATFETKLRFCGIRGSLACAPGTTTNVQCAGGGTGPLADPLFPSLKASLGCADSAADAGGGDASAGPAAENAGDGGCSIGSPSDAPVALMAVASLGALVLLRRRRRV